MLYLWLFAFLQLQKSGPSVSWCMDFWIRNWSHVTILFILLLLLLSFLLFLLLLWVTLFKKCLWLHCFKSDWDETWQDSSSSKYALIDGVGFLIWQIILARCCLWCHFMQKMLQSAACTCICSCFSRLAAGNSICISWSIVQYLLNAVQCSCTIAMHWRLLFYKYRVIAKCILNTSKVYVICCQGRIKGGAKGAAAPGPAISRGPHFWEVQEII